MAITQTQVSELYVAILGRASEGEGNEFWMAEDNTSTAATAMLASADAITYFGASLDTDQAFIEAIYLNTLGKTYAEDPTGIDFWVAALATSDRGTVVAGLVDAANDPANAGDAQDMFQNKVAFSNYTAANVYAVDSADMSPFDISTITEDSSTLTDAILAVVVDEPEDGDGDGGGGDEEPGDEGTDDVVLLTADQDIINTGGGNDTILGYIFDNQNTAQSGDTIDGGTGDDSLYADIGNSQEFAITLHTESVETFSVRAQTQDGGQDEGENNMNDVQIDAERMNGTDRYESDNSRADVTIEDVRIEDSQITQDITVAMVQTDPGDVDFGLYFDIHSLRNAADVESGAVLGLNLMDIEATASGDDPLLSNPYDQITFTLDGVSYTLELQNIIDVKTYADFEAAVSLAVSLTAGLEDVTVERLGNTFDAIYTGDGLTYTGETISLINNGDGDFEIGSWNASGGIPAAGEYLLDQVPGSGVVSSSLITSTIVLDDVGRGSMGGDLIIGGLSTGITSDSTGVEQFNITVERSSELQEINSTNNTLQEVYIVNGENQGNLVVAGDTNGDNDLPGAQGDAGFTDVRVVDASTMVGTVSINAELTGAVVGKYMDLQDDASNPAIDNTTFKYTLGTSDDTLNLVISNANLAAAGTTAREDFGLDIDGRAGDDTITTIIGNGLVASNWYTNSKENANLSVDGGAGNDTITTTGSGDFFINAGTGNDTVYADNLGAKSIFVVNATNFALPDLITQPNANYFLVDGQLSITLDDTYDTDTATAGVSGYEVLVDIPTGDNYTVTNLHINQAIKDGINNDAVLSKLLVAEDGPGNTLVITSLIDDALIAGNLDIVINTPNYGAYSLSQQNSVEASYQSYMNDSTETWANAVTTSEANADFDGAGVAAGAGISGVINGLAGSVVSVVGANSGAESDNTITGSTGDDVLVLGTGALSNDTIVFSGTFGNDTVVNFADTAAAVDSDTIDFSAYLSDLESASTSVDSQVTIATTSDFTGVAAYTVVDGNEVIVINDFIGDNGIDGLDGTADDEEFANLTGAKLLSAIEDTINAADNFGNILNTSLDSVNANANLVGTSLTSVVMVENDNNAGEYKVFEVTSSTTTNEFTAATLVGTIDFGEEIAAVTQFA